MKDTGPSRDAVRRRKVRPFPRVYADTENVRHVIPAGWVLARCGVKVTAKMFGGNRVVTCMACIAMHAVGLYRKNR